MEFFIISYLLIAHYVSDFLLQSRKMATSKSSSIKWLSIHVGIYTLTMYTFLLILTFIFPEPNIAQVVVTIIKWALLNGVLHWITDYTTSRISGYYYQQDKLSQFWYTIGFDQLIHTITILGTYQYFFL